MIYVTWSMMFVLKVTESESSFPAAVFGGELFVSHCAELLTPGKKDTLLESIVFRHAFPKKKKKRKGLGFASGCNSKF